MLCEICNKNKASIHLTEVNTAKSLKRELHICEECAQRKGIFQKVHLSINEMLGKVEAISISKEETELRCSYCGLSLSDFKQNMRFGCGNDYEIFKSEILPLLERIHSSTKYIGKHPQNINATEKLLLKISELERELEEYIKNENFEQAASVRDKIKGLKTKLLGNKNEDR